MAKKFNIDGVKSMITSDKVLTSEAEARERFWSPSEQRTIDSDYKNNNDLSNNKFATNLNVSLIIPDPNQPRKHFNKSSLEDLSNSIRERGVESPIIVRPVEDEKFKIIAGERRWRCSVSLGLKTIPAIIKKLNDADAYMLALTENIQRESLHYLDESEAFKRMIDQGYVKDQKQLAEKLGKSKGYISEKFKILSLPHKVKALIYETDSISFSHAVLLAQVKDADTAFELAHKIPKGELPVRRLEALLSSGAAEKPENPRHKSSFQPVQIKAVTNGFNLTVKYRKDRPEDILKIINIFEQKIEELKNKSKDTENDASSHV